MITPSNFPCYPSPGSSDHHEPFCKLRYWTTEKNHSSLVDSQRWSWCFPQWTRVIKTIDNLKSWALSEIIKIEEAGGPLNALVPCDLGIVFPFDAFSAVDHLLSIFQSPVFLRNEGTFYNQCVSIKWRILALDWSLTQLIYPHVVVFCIFKTTGVHTLLLSCSHLEWSATTIMWASFCCQIVTN